VAEQPIYFQLAFALDRVRYCPPTSGVEGQGAFASLFKVTSKVRSPAERLLFSKSHGHALRMTTVEFDHCPQLDRRPPSIRHRAALYGNGLSADARVLAYLRGNGFQDLHRVRGGIDFMRPWSEKVYAFRPSSRRQ